MTTKGQKDLKPEVSRGFFAVNGPVVRAMVLCTAIARYHRTKSDPSRRESTHAIISPTVWHKMSTRPVSGANTADVSSSGGSGDLNKGNTVMNILTLNLLFSTFVFWIAASIYILPRLPQLESKTILLPILLLHSMRHLGLMFLAPGATFPGIPRQFAYPAAFGDLLAALLALLAILSLVRNMSSARLIIWVFAIEGTIDLFAAITLATLFDASPFMGPAYWIPAFWVPALLVTHYITFVVLVKHWKGVSRT